MKKIDKTIFSGFIALFLSSPFFSNAQYSVPSNTGLPAGELGSIIVVVMQWMLSLIGVIGIIGFVIAGILYLTSAGDDNKAGTAKKAMTYCIIGMVVALLGFVVIKAVDTMLGGAYTDF